MNTTQIKIQWTYITKLYSIIINISHTHENTHGNKVHKFQWNNITELYNILIYRISIKMLIETRFTNFNEYIYITK